MFFAKKNVKNFCTAKVPHIFFGKNDSIFGYNRTEILTTSLDLNNLRQIFNVKSFRF